MAWLIGKVSHAWHGWRVLAASACYWLAMIDPAAAQDGGGSRVKQSLAWGLVVLMVVLGMMVTLLPPKRDTEVKGRRE